MIRSSEIEGVPTATEVLARDTVAGVAAVHFDKYPQPITRPNANIRTAYTIPIAVHRTMTGYAVEAVARTRSTAVSGTH
jgi:hypothetical protein